MSAELGVLLAELYKKKFVKYYKEMEMRNFEYGYILEFKDSLPMFIGKRFGVQNHLNLGSLIAFNSVEKQIWKNLSKENKRIKLAQCVDLVNRQDGRINIVPSVEDLSSVDVDTKIELNGLEDMRLTEKIWHMKEVVRQMALILTLPE